MDNYIKDSVVEVEECLPFGDLCPENVIHMKVKTGTKVKNIIEYSAKHFIDNERERYVVVSGCANSSNKAISCSEILKRNFENQFKRHLFQMTKIGYKTIEEFWKPKDNTLDTLKVVRRLPKIYILLSKDSLDLNEPGVQHKDNVFGHQSDDKKGFKRNDFKSKQSKYKSKQKTPKNNRRDNESNDAKGSTLQS